MTPLGSITPPPRLARRLLAALLPAELGDDVVANLDDLHARHARRRGQRRADAWYWRQAVSLPIRLRVAGDRPGGVAFTTRTTIMRSILQDLRYAYRLHRARPAFALVAVLSLALAIGLNTAIFSVVDGVLLKPAPFDDFDRLVMVWETDRNTGTTREPGSVPDFLDYRERATSFGALGSLIASEVTWTPGGGEPVRLATLSVSADVLPMLGVQTILGRPFTRRDEQAPEVPRQGIEAVSGVRTGASVLISESLWRRAFDADPAAVGRTLVLNDVPATVVGVVPDATDFGVLQVLSAGAYSRSFADRGTRTRVDVWTPLAPDPANLPRSTHPNFMVGRLAADVSVAQAQDEMTTLAAELEAAYPENNGRGVHVEALSDVVFGPVRPAFLALLGAVGFVLLVACVNVANLLLALGETRRREVAIRAALGAGARRLSRQFLTETVALTLIAAALGIGVGYAAFAWLVAAAPASLPRLASASIDLRVLSLTLGVAVLIGIAFGLVPALQARQTAPRTALSGGADRHGTGGRRGTRARAALVVAELALAVVLVVGAGLLLKSFWRVQQVDPGFQTAGVAKAEFQLPPGRYPVDFSRWPDFAEIHAFTRSLLEETRRVPGVTAVAVAGNHPLDPGFTNSFSVVGREAEARDWPEISVRRVTGDYFPAVGLELRRGRLIDDRDGTTAPPVTVINEAAAARFFPDTDPIGHEINLWGDARRIVGVVADERFQGVTTAPAIAMYTPLWQTPSTGAGVLLVRSATDAASLGSVLPRVVRAVDPALAVFGVEPLDETLARSQAQRRFTMSLVVLFAAMALGLAAIGVHGVLGYSVRQRTREIGIRVALGARPEGVRRLVVRQGLLLAAIGLVIGLAGALALGRLFEALLFGVTPADPATLLTVAALLGLVALVASYLPARWATGVDPIEALRSEQ